MLNTNHVDYLVAKGISYIPAESPSLWAQLESYFAESTAIGSRFTHLPQDRVAELIAEGEKALLNDLVALHRQKGHIERVTHVLNLPFAVGTEAVKLRDEVDPRRILSLIEAPGTMRERIIDVLPSKADEIPSTHKVTIEGGLYADGRTAGYFGLYPGEITRRAGDDDEGKIVFLATPDEIRILIREMQENLGNITAVTRAKAETMIQKAKLMVK